jgi:cytochrome b561
MMIFMLLFSAEMMDIEEEEAGGLLPSVQSIGSAILILSVIRILWRLINPPPPLPSTMAPWARIASKWVHVLFYVLLLALPITGWLAFHEVALNEPSMAGVMNFGVLPVPDAPNTLLPAGELHGFLSSVSLALLAFHLPGGAQAPVREWR